MGRGETAVLNLPRMKGWDLIPLLLTLVLAGGLAWMGVRQLEGQPMVEIQTPEGQFVYPMSTDRYFPARGPLGTSVITIRDGQAWFESSPCQNQICVQMGHQHEPGQWAACLPNRIFLRITARREEVDVISQ